MRKIGNEARSRYKHLHGLCPGLTGCRGDDGDPWQTEYSIVKFPKSEAENPRTSPLEPCPYPLCRDSLQKQ